MRSAGRINFAVVAVTATLFLAIAAFVAFSTSKMMENEARSTVENVVKAAVGRIDSQKASVESAVENSAWIVAERIADPDYMFKITGELVQNNPFIVGSTVAFEPNFFPSKGYYYSAFSCPDGKGGVKRIQQGGETFKYHGMDWYRIPKESKKSSWSFSTRLQRATAANERLSSELAGHRADDPVERADAQNTAVSRDHSSSRA